MTTGRGQKQEDLTNQSQDRLLRACSSVHITGKMTIFVGGIVKTEASSLRNQLDAWNGKRERVRS